MVTDHSRTPLAIVLAAGLLTLVACSRQVPKQTAAPVLAVEMARVEARDLDVSIDVTGSLVSSVAVDVKTEFPGRLVAMLKREGDPVGKGEMIAQLDDANASLTLGQARAALEVAKAALDRARVGEDHARRELERAENLLKSGGITDRDFQAARMTSRDGAAQVKLAEAQVAQAQETVALAAKRVHDCRIISPIAGEVERKLLNPGGWLDGNAPLYRLVDNQRLEVDASVSSSEISRVKKGQQIRFAVAAYPGETFDAAVSNISAGVDVSNRSTALRATATNPGGRLKAGMFIKGKIITATNPKAIIVPAGAVWRRAGQSPFVYVVENQRARKREVKTGQEETAGIEVTSGLAAGETIIVEQNLELAEGASVAPRT
jgi:RND family efflux transporter MFP subunit